MPNQFISPEGDLENYFITESWLIDQYLGKELWVWGSNNFCQLGINDAQNRSTPVTTFAGATNWKQVSCGYFTSAIKNDGTLWTWGWNSNGQLGVNDANTRSTPVTTFTGGTDWKQVSTGYTHVAAIKTDGSLWAWGNNASGALGINTSVNTTRSTPVTTFAGGTDWKQVSCGRENTAVIKTDGTLWVWGRNSYGQLGVNDTINRSTPVTTFAGGTNWKQVVFSSCSNRHSAAIKTDGTLWLWGRNNSAQLGVNDAQNRSTPVTTFAGGTDWKYVSLSLGNTSAIKTNGTLWIWGLNSEMELGINASGTRSTPVTTFAGGTNWKQSSSGSLHTTAIKTDGTLWVWGYNNFGQLGDNFSSGSVSCSTPVTTFAGGTNWNIVSTAGSQNISLKFNYEGN